jgi:glycosyltransferase involved in cell wall biosynthesis
VSEIEPALSVVIPCRNGAAFLARQLDALATQDTGTPFEVIVADNGSDDASVAVALEFQERIPGLRIVDASARRGQAFARNKGAAAARGCSLLFVDADDEVAPGYLEAMAGALTRHEFVSAAFDTETLNRNWSNGTRASHQLRGVQNSFGFLPFAGGGGLGIRRDVFDRVRGFDVDHWRSGQDIDFCWRVQLAGSPLEFVPEAVLRVGFRSSLSGMYRQGRHYGRGEAFLYSKFRRLGMPRSPVKRAMWRWWTLARRLPRLRTRRDLGNWLRRAGESVGRLQGSVRHMVLFL